MVLPSTAACCHTNLVAPGSCCSVVRPREELARAPAAWTASENMSVFVSACSGNLPTTLKPHIREQLFMSVVFLMHMLGGARHLCQMLYEVGALHCIIWKRWGS